MYLYLHAPRPINANPPNPRGSAQNTGRGPWPTVASAVPSGPRSTYEPENNHIITIDL